ncbi:16S rRNA (guanine(966)-N(2))-methyltransferase RsmD [Desulfonema magnum]|uniref:16S rRNA (Guanine(966)-N(2))-methyltransferase n=1 Tax=Desulfonema magnum TaxID=45655 RepID=A0A975GR95_9BACT|nr:16S rRNA (guanine(966)-N(2))-methyltransferase RsmD [Desulfonema magnum]QTA90687.1 16S rRNA (guanine(966)-N(2))-methyltransferase [Desulfonema magnum]
MRIISGELKGRKLHSVRGMAIRPTADRVRESLFNILSSHVREAVVLDLFAGTGAFGIEALSRGAAFAVFIDKHKSALSTVARNIRSCGLENRTKTIKWDIQKNLNCIKLTSFSAFNLVFMDPPYNRNLIKPSLCNLRASGSLEKGAIVAVEHSLSEAIPENYTEYVIADQRKYGKTLVSFLNYMI